MLETLKNAWKIADLRQKILYTLLIVGFGFFMSGIYPSTLAGVNREIGGSDLAMSILVTLGGIGGIAMPAAIGFVSEQVGITGGMWLLMGVAAITMLLILYNCYITNKENA